MNREVLERNPGKGRCSPQSSGIFRRRNHSAGSAMNGTALIGSIIAAGQERKPAIPHYEDAGRLDECVMAFLATLLAYLGFVSGIAVALLMSLGAFLAAPKQPLNQQAIVHQTVAMAPKPIEPKIAAITSSATTSSATNEASATQILVGSRHSRPSRTFGSTVAVRRIRTVNTASRDQNHGRDPQEHASQWAYQLVPDFDSRYIGYVNEPAADTSRIR